jgi:hypothetical protein
MDIKKFADDILAGSTRFLALTDPTDNDFYAFSQKNGFTETHLVTVLEEIFLNAREHGSGKILFYFHKDGSTLLFGIRDLLGVGIHETVPKNPRLVDVGGKEASSILRLSLEKGITGTGDVGRGIGLFLLKDFVQKSKGESYLASDSAFLRQNINKIFESDLGSEIKGSLVCLKINQ